MPRRNPFLASSTALQAQNAVRWVVDALEQHSDAREIDIEVAETLELGWMLGDVRTRELVVEIIEVATRAESTSRSVA